MPRRDNQNEQVQRGPKAHYVCNREGYFDGKLPVFFMPGQSSGIVNKDFPKRWPLKNTLALRMPCTVFLSSLFPPSLCGEQFELQSRWSNPGWYGHWFDADPITHVSYNRGSLMFRHGGSYEFMDWLLNPERPDSDYGARRADYKSRISNEILKEHLRLIGVYRAVKRYFETKYYGKVWVQICQWMPSDITFKTTQDLFKQRGPDPAALTNQPIHMCMGPPWMLAPTGTDFVGTNFLHVYAGFPASMRETNMALSLNLHHQLPPNVNAWFLWNFWGLFQYIAAPPGFNFNKSTGVIIKTFIVDDLNTPGTYVGNGIFIKQLFGAAERDVGFTYPGTIDGVMAMHMGDYGTKRDVLRQAVHKFANYKTIVSPYSLPWSFDTSRLGFQNYSPRTVFPRYEVKYSEQDWVEGILFPPTIDHILNDIIPGGGFDRGDSFESDGSRLYDSKYWGPYGYNVFYREPLNENYEYNISMSMNERMTKHLWRLEERFYRFKSLLEGLEPSHRYMFEQFIARDNLDALGFEARPNSSWITTDSLIAEIEAQFNLDPDYESKLTGPDWDTRGEPDDSVRDYPTFPR